ncbi:MAG: hypothetical protein ACREQD_17220 [Candidatus Binataceae bacterium]
MAETTSQFVDQSELVAAIPRELYYAGGWHAAVSGARTEITSPSTGVSLGRVAWAGAEDVDHAARAGNRAARPAAPSSMRRSTTACSSGWWLRCARSNPVSRSRRAPHK